MERANLVKQVIAVLAAEMSATHFHSGLEAEGRQRAIRAHQAVVAFLEYHNNSSPCDDHYSRIEDLTDPEKTSAERNPTEIEMDDRHRP